MVTPMTHNQHYNLYVSSCTENGGIYPAVIDGKGRIEFADMIPLAMPMYAVANDNKLFVLLRHPFNDSVCSGIVNFDIDTEGKLTNKSETLTTMGEVACHLCVNGSDVYAVNYISGSVIKFPDKVVRHIGSSVNAKRQESAHTHFVSITPGGKFVIVTDLGMDKIFIYNRNLKFVRSFDVAEGTGPRHLAFSDDGKFLFCVNELSSTLTAYRYEDGNLYFCDEKSCLTDKSPAESTAAAVRFYKDKIYVSNRGEDSIAVFGFGSSGLVKTDVFPSGGVSPRDFTVADDMIICANEGSDNISVINKEGKIISSYNCIKNPVCVTLKR